MKKIITLLVLTFVICSVCHATIIYEGDQVKDDFSTDTSSSWSTYALNWYWQNSRLENNASMAPTYFNMANFDITGTSWASGTVTASVQKGFFSTENIMGLCFGMTGTYASVSGFYAAFIWTESGGLNSSLQIRKYSWNGSNNYDPEGAAQVQSISDLSVDTPYTLSLDVDTTSATLSLGGDSVSYSYSAGDQVGSIGFVSGPGWTLYDDFSATVIPEPGTIALLGIAIPFIGYGIYRRRKTK